MDVAEIHVTEYGEPVYATADLVLTPGRIGKWVHTGDQGYDEALAAQREVEESWIERRECLGDG